MYSEGPLFIENQIELFPKLEKLTKLEGSPIEFSWKDKKFEVAALGIDDIHGTKIFLGLWEKTDVAKLPVGYCDAYLDKETGQIIVGEKSHDLDFDDVALPIEFENLENIEITDSDRELGKLEVVAFILDKDYRKTGIADVFNAQSILLFQALGAKEILYRGDTTTHSEDESSFIPNFKTDKKSSLIKQQETTSFYSKYSTQHTISLDKGIMDGRPYEDYRTTIEPRLSTMQVSLLKEAGF